MKGSQLAVAGGVFVAVLIVCFALVGFGSKGEATAKPDTVPTIPPANPADVPPAEPPLPSPKPPAVALGGFGQVAKLERGYDGTAFLTQFSAAAQARIAKWRLPADDVAGFGDTYREARLTADRFVGVSETAVRVLDARTGDPQGFGRTSKTVLPPTAVSPDGDWAVQWTTGIELLDLTAGGTLKLPSTTKRTLTGPAGFGSDNDWCAILGRDGDKPAVFRLRKDGTAELLGRYRADTARGDASRIARVFAGATAGRIVMERPGEKSPNPRLLAWNPPASDLVPVPAFSAETHDSVQHVRLSGDGRYLALFDDATLKVFDLDTGRALMTHRPADMDLADAAFAPNGERLIVAYRWRRVAGDPENGEAEKTLVPARAVVFDVKQGEAVGRSLSFGDLGVTKAGVRRCVLSADGSRLAVVEVSGTVHLIDTAKAFGAESRTEKPAPAVAPTVSPSVTPAGPEPTTAPAPKKPAPRLADS